MRLRLLRSGISCDCSSWTGLSCYLEWLIELRLRLGGQVAGQPLLLTLAVAVPVSGKQQADRCVAWLLDKLSVLVWLPQRCRARLCVCHLFVTEQVKAAGICRRPPLHSASCPCSVTQTW